MPKLINKFIFSLLSFLIAFFSLAPYLSVRAADCNPANATRTCPLQTVCDVGSSRYCCTSATACTDFKTSSSSSTDSGPAPTAAPTSWYNQSFSGWFAKVYDENTSPSSEIFGERYTAAQVQWVIFSLVAFLINTSGEAGTRAVSCMMSGDLNSCAGAIQEAVGSIKLSDGGTQTWASAFSMNQMSGVGYISQKINAFHLIPEANAQGFGYSAASPVQKLWVVIRNITFGLIILAVITMAFMIMFRVKISPQTIITVQSALPKIIIALILISFSYAIAGLAIDIMYVVMGLLSTLITTSGISTYSAPEFFAFLNAVSVPALIIGYLLYFFLAFVNIFAGAGAAVALGLGASGTALGAGAEVGGFLGSVLGILILAVMAIVLLIATFKIMWLLLKTYVNILLKIIFGPIQILMGTVTSSGGFGAWLKAIAADLSVFPVVSFLFFIAFFFLAQSFKNMGTLPGSVPVINIGGFDLADFIINSFPFKINPDFLSSTASWTPPMTVGANGLQLLWLGASFAILVLIPKTADIINGLISGKPFAYGTAIGEAFGPASTVARGGLAWRAGGVEEARAEAAKDQGQEYTVPGWIQALRTTGILRK